MQNCVEWHDCFSMTLRSKPARTNRVERKDGNWMERIVA